MKAGYSGRESSARYCTCYASALSEKNSQIPAFLPLQVCSGFYYPPRRHLAFSGRHRFPAARFIGKATTRRGDGRALPQPCRTNRVTDRRLPLQPHHAQKKKNPARPPLRPPQSTAPRLPNCPSDDWAVPFLHQSLQFKFQTSPHCAVRPRCTVAPAALRRRLLDRGSPDAPGAVRRGTSGRLLPVEAVHGRLIRTLSLAASNCKITSFSSGYSVPPFFDGLIIRLSPASPYHEKARCETPGVSCALGARS